MKRKKKIDVTMPSSAVHKVYIIEITLKKRNFQHYFLIRIPKLT